MLGRSVSFGQFHANVPVPRQVGVDLALEAPMEAVRAKSLALGDLLIRLVDQQCPAGHSLRLVSPADRAQRGSQLCFAHPEAYGIVQARARRASVLCPANMSAATLLERLRQVFFQPCCLLRCYTCSHSGAVQVAVKTQRINMWGNYMAECAKQM